MGKPSAPKAPDYAAAATEQGKANVNSAIATNFLNQANQVGPNGTLSYNYDYNHGYKLPDGTVVPQTTATTILSPEQQKLLDQNNLMSGTMNDLAIKGLDYVDQATSSPIDQSKLPSMVGGLARSPFADTADPTKLGVQGAYDFSKASRMPTMDDFKTQRDQVTDAYMQRLAPYMKQQQDAMDAKLATQGITNGSEAWGFDQGALGRNQNDQRIAALLAGDQQQQNLFNNAMALHGQGINEAMSQGNFNNDAQATEFAQNQQGLQNFNQGAEANFGQGLASAQFQDQARQQAIQEADYFKNQPLNMLNALRSGNQVNMPQFGNVTAGSTIAPAPVYQAVNDGYDAALKNYQIKAQQSSALMSGLASIGGAAITHWSDRRLKTFIKKVVEFADGLGWYEYRFKNDLGLMHYGVMADEVERLRPWAFIPNYQNSGYNAVNYGAL